MFKYLLVGDPHVTVEEMVDCERLIDAVVDAAQTERRVAAVVFLGDLHHNHAIVHVDIIAFWKRALARLRAVVPRVILLRGNHDAPTSGSTAHALMSYEGIDGVVVVDRPMVLDSIAFVPYTADREEFLRACRDLRPGNPPVSALICHQTFDGSAYDNGFYAGDGVAPELVPQERVVSGHIHTPQAFGKVSYPGAPRWRTTSDANTERSIWAVEFENGAMGVVRRHPTRGFCRAIWKTVVRDGQVVEGPAFDSVDVKPGDQWHIDVYGAADANKSLASTLTRPGNHVRCFSTDTVAPRVRESEGVDASFRRFLSGYRPRHETPVPVLEKMAAERFSWR
jgi:DNA repair exonuclease SbcCD nuclease subunit